MVCVSTRVLLLLHTNILCIHVRYLYSREKMLEFHPPPFLRTNLLFLPFSRYCCCYFSSTLSFWLDGDEWEDITDLLLDCLHKHDDDVHKGNVFFFTLNNDPLDHSSFFPFQNRYDCFLQRRCWLLMHFTFGSTTTSKASWKEKKAKEIFPQRWSNV